MLRLRILIPIILISVSLLIAYFYIKPMYTEIVRVSSKKVRIVDALKKTKDIGSIIGRLRSDLKSVSRANLDKMDVILPSSIDEMRYLNMISSLAGTYKIPISKLKINNSEDGKNTAVGGVPVAPGDAPSGEKIQNISIEFSASAEYETFKDFLRSLESSLVLFNVDSISLDSNNKKEDEVSNVKSDGNDVYIYNVKLTTYLKK